MRDKLIEFVRETARHITTTADVSPELQQLRYCLCAVARQCGIQLGDALPQAFPGQVGERRSAAPDSVPCCALTMLWGLLLVLPRLIHIHLHACSHTTLCRRGARCTTCSHSTAKRRRPPGSSRRTCGASSPRVGAARLLVARVCVLCCLLECTLGEEASPCN